MPQEFADYIKTDEITFKHAKGMRDIIGKEFHPYNEVFLFLNGDAEFISEKMKVSLLPNTLVIIPKESFHQFIVHGAEKDYHRCVFNFKDIRELNEIIEQKINTVYPLPATEEMIYLFNRLINATQETLNHCEERILLKSIMGQLLVSLSHPQSEQASYQGFHPITRDAIKYIHAHIQENMQVSSIASALHVSASHLMHVFKRDLHISIYKYVTEKKLILAKEKIEEGMPPMQAAALCGFNEYSGFYKMYKKMFECSPSDDKQQ